MKYTSSIVKSIVDKTRALLNYKIIYLFVYSIKWKFT